MNEWVNCFYSMDFKVSILLAQDEGLHLQKFKLDKSVNSNTLFKGTNYILE